MTWRFLLTTGILAVTTASHQAPGSAQVAPTCQDPVWHDIGLEAFHCAAGACEFIEGSGTEPSRFHFTIEPDLHLRAGGVAGALQQDDTLIAVNGFLITSSRGGRELAGLTAERDVTLTIRRAGRVLDVSVRAVPSCRPPLVWAAGQSGVEGRIRPVAGDVPMLDFSRPRAVGPTAIDLSLGFTVRCPGCEIVLNRADVYGVVSDYPTVIAVDPQGVAAEAGLQPGDVIRTVSGRDVRSLSGPSPLFDLPPLDFVMTYRRGDQVRSAFMNRRIVDRRGLDNDPPPTNGAWAIVVRGVQWRSEATRPVSLVGGQPVFVEPPFVAWVAPASAGERSGLEPGDVLVAVNGEGILEMAGTRTLLSPPLNRPLRLTIRRGQAILELSLDAAR